MLEKEPTGFVSPVTAEPAPASPRPAETAEEARAELARERDRLQLLLEVNNAVVSNLELPDVFAAISAFCRDRLHHEYTSLSLLDKDEPSRLRIQALDFPSGKGLIREEMTVPLVEVPAHEAIRLRRPVRFDAETLRHMGTGGADLLLAEGLISGVCLPLLTRNGVLGTLNLASYRAGAFDDEDIEMLGQIAVQFAIALENALAYCEIEELKNRLAEEKVILEDEMRSGYQFEDIVGESDALRNVLRQVETVAPTDSTVLLLGETGTGKERVARAIHNLSRRKDAPFVKINCAAIPTGLLESELFGHEKGAFTGAIAQKLGRFELADRGTIFLDEVGDIPLELQPKLLRVLQEQEFERLGGGRTIRVDVRLIAATNRELAAMVASREFRSDLYYRLNVFPVRIPPLRERAEDIPLLARFFAQMYSLRLNRNIETIPTETMEALTRYSWPGNIRELENLVERAVILSPGSVLRVPLSELQPASQAAAASVATLEEMEREHIRQALRASRGQLSGPAGAAARLGIKRTTLQSRMKKLGIERES
ncbi:MAG TPA: sigma 54-interacting transcriptional regulator [Candidatus Binatia bacterium]|nr:sigma 54-interacting transcriptional regulator [Candidatus Binatia bacterium]